MHIGLPSKLKDVKDDDDDGNGDMLTLDLGWQLKWVALPGQALSLSINCCPSTVAHTGAAGEGAGQPG